jgi:predicted MFS family arabinose efflux permease
MVFLGFMMSGLGELSYLVIRSTEQFFAVQILMGIGLGILNPAWDTLYSDEKDGVSPVRKWCVWTSGVEISDGLAALLGAVLLKLWGFNALFCAMAALNAVAVCLSFRIMKPNLPEQGGMDVQTKIQLG